MSRNKDYKPEKNPLLAVLYIIAVILLVCALAFMVFTVRDRRKKQEEAVQKIASEETEFIIPERESETESESETEKKTAKKSSDKNTASKTAASAQKSSKNETEEVSEEESETESESEVDKDMSILVLNGTRKQGVAAYWKKELVKAGFSDVYTASYSEEVAEHTVLYSDNMAAETVFEEYFPNCEVRKGTVEKGIEPEGETQLPDEIDLYIVVGKNDSKNE